MTIIALHYTDNELLAISDGLISKGVNRVIESDNKISVFKPNYKIPRVSVGRFSHFEEYNDGEFLIGYAGTYSVISTILTHFKDIVARLLILDRDKKDGTPTVYQRSDAGQGLKYLSYWDSYNFAPTELPRITVNFLMNILQRVSEAACKDFTNNAMESPEIQFFIYGNCSNDYRHKSHIQIMKCQNVRHNIVDIRRHTVLPWSLEFLGDSTVFDNLRESIESENAYSQAPIQEKKYEFDWVEETGYSTRFAINRQKVIKRKVLQLIETGTQSIGGDVLLAEKSWASSLTLSKVPNNKINELISESKDN